MAGRFDAGHTTQDDPIGSSTQSKPKKKKLSGVNVGGAFCCMPGATLGAIWDGWRAGDEAKELKAKAFEREARAQERRRTGLDNRNSLTGAVMSDDRSMPQPGADASSAANPDMAASRTVAPPAATQELEQHQVKEVLHCLLHTIIFNRALGPVRPREVDLQLFDLTYAHCGDAAVDAKVNEKVVQFCAAAARHPDKVHQVVLSFYEARRKQPWALGFGAQEERLFWEQWIINTRVIETNDAFEENNVRSKRSAALQGELEARLAEVVRAVNERKDHIPPVVSPATVTFPFEIAIAGDAGRGFGLDTVKRLLMHTSPPPARLDLIRREMMGPSSSHDAALRVLQAKLAKKGKHVLQEYDEVRAADPTFSTQEADSLAHERRNRYFNVVPFDRNRVRLRGGGQDYINASLLGSAEGEPAPWHYIATQGPLPATTPDFWRMVWEQGSGVLVMLTRLNEQVVKCAPYFPDSAGSSVAYGDFSVALDEARELDEDITMRRLTLTRTRGGDGGKAAGDPREAPRLVCHYQYHAWPDHGIPETTRPLRRLAHLLEDTRVPSNGPAVVHCSAGIGRTGTFCTIDIVLRRLRTLGPDAKPEEVEWAVAIPQVVSQLRQQRVGMVQTPEQYMFCYRAVVEELAEGASGSS